MSEMLEAAYVSSKSAPLLLSEYMALPFLLPLPPMNNIALTFTSIICFRFHYLKVSFSTKLVQFLQKVKSKLVYASAFIFFSKFCFCIFFIFFCMASVVYFYFHYQNVQIILYLARPSITKFSLLRHNCKVPTFSL